MSRVQPLSKIEDPQLSALFEKGSEIMGFASVDALIMAHCPEVLDSTSSWIMSILQKGKIDPGLKRLMGYICSTAAGCIYCSAHTNYTARFYNVDERKMKSAWTFEESALFSDAEKAALNLAKVSSSIPNETSDEDFARLRQYYSDSEIVEIVFTISLYAFLNKFNSTMNTDLEDAPRQLFEQLNRNL